MKATTIEITVPQRTFGEKVRAVRQFLRHMTQMEVAKQVGISQNAMSQIESGEIPNPRANVVKRLAEVLEVPADYLLGVGEPANAAYSECSPQEVHKAPEKKAPPRRRRRPAKASV